VRAVILAAIVALVSASCSAANSSDDSGKKLSQYHDLAALVAVPVRLKSGFGTGIQGFIISGSVFNHETIDMPCTNAVFSIMIGKKQRAPVGGYCTRGRIPPNEAAEFSMTFPMLPSENPSLRLDHPDGTYETADLAIPPPQQ
jgi:hypothetical protein